MRPFLARPNATTARPLPHTCARTLVSALWRNSHAALRISAHQERASRRTGVLVNLIPFNPHGEQPRFLRPTHEAVQRFQATRPRAAATPWDAVDLSIDEGGALPHTCVCSPSSSYSTLIRMAMVIVIASHNCGHEA